ncbi:helix-turn-helix domain-containing protein [Kerstersia similis]|uniref:helix-turn-helix domain-containing protein n=1 Tax=Kerstersia similis TaxID=206505 RepID=UPI0039F0C35A
MVVMPPSNPGLFQHSTKQIGKRRFHLATFMPHRTRHLLPIKLRLNISLNGKNLRRQAHFRGYTFDGKQLINRLRKILVNPSIRTLAWECCVSERTVQRALKRLEAKIEARLFDSISSHQRAKNDSDSHCHTVPSEPKSSQIGRNRECE